MKKLILLFVLVCSLSHGIDISLNMEAGYYPFGTTFLWLYYGKIEQGNTFYVSSDLSLDFFDFLYFNGKMRIDVSKRSDDGVFYEFTPVSLLSVADIGIKYKYFSIGYTHKCIHPITPYDPIYRVIDHWEGWSAAAYIRVELKGKILDK